MSANPFLLAGAPGGWDANRSSVPALVAGSGSAGHTSPHEVFTAADDPFKAGTALSARAGPGTRATPEAVRRELVIIDPRVPDYQELAAGVVGRKSGKSVQVVVLDGAGDGIEQVSRILARYHGLDAVHIVSHGQPGEIQLGSTWLDSGDLSRYAAEIRGWSRALNRGADLLFYGCDVAETGQGQALLRRVGKLTGADVAGSTDLTGGVAEGGNWTLEYHTGPIHTTVPFTEATLRQWQGVLATFTVSNTNNGGAGSLRQAILNANGTPGTNTITFGIGSGTQTIKPTSALPAITNPILIDGTSQPGFGGTPLIVLDGSLAGAGASGLVITAGNSTVRGLVINHFGANAIELDTHGNDRITGNYLGTDVTGAAAAGNGAYGVAVNSGPADTIGGTAAGAGNLISGNTQGGVRITGPSFLVSEDNNDVLVDARTGAVLATYPTGVANDSTVVGADGSLYAADYYKNQVLHYDAAGTFLGSFGSGHLSEPQDMAFGPGGNLYVGDVASSVQRFSPSGTFLGTFIPAGSGGLSNTKAVVFGPDGNAYVASLNTNSVLRYNGTTGAFMGAFVASGSGGLSYPEDLQFGPDGNLYVTSYATNRVLRYSGTTGAFLGTFVSGNLATPYGLRFDQAGNLDVACRSLGEIQTYDGTTGAFLHNLVTGLTNPAWFTTTPGASGGDVIQGNSIGTNAAGSGALANGSGVLVDAGNDTIGGTAAGAGNTIAYNTGKGVVVAGGSGNAIQGNAIFANAGLGIDLNNDGVRANTGTRNAALANDGMNFPVFTSAAEKRHHPGRGRLCRPGGGAGDVRRGPHRHLQGHQRPQRPRPGPNLPGFPDR